MVTAEKISIYTLIILSLLLSAFFIDLFPFSLNPLFTKKTQHYSFIQLKDHNGKLLANGKFGIFLDYDSQFERSGLHSKRSINKMGSHIEQTQLKKHLLKQLDRFPFLQEIAVKVFNVTGTKEGLKYQSYSFVIPNPYFKKKSFVNSDVYEEDKYKRRIKNGVLFAP